MSLVLQGAYPSIPAGVLRTAASLVVVSNSFSNNPIVPLLLAFSYLESHLNRSKAVSSADFKLLLVKDPVPEKLNRWLHLSSSLSLRSEAVKTPLENTHILETIQMPNDGRIAGSDDDADAGGATGASHSLKQASVDATLGIPASSGETDLLKTQVVRAGKVDLHVPGSLQTMLFFAPFSLLSRARSLYNYPNLNKRNLTCKPCAWLMTPCARLTCKPNCQKQ